MEREAVEKQRRLESADKKKRKAGNGGEGIGGDSGGEDVGGKRARQGNAKFGHGNKVGE